MRRNRVREYNIKRPFGYRAKWEWKQILFIKWGFIRHEFLPIPFHINCRCTFVGIDKEGI